MKMKDLLKMDMGEVSQWLIDNQYDFELVPKEYLKDSLIKRVEELETWQEKAFDAHPNIDIDIELLTTKHTIR